MTNDREGELAQYEAMNRRQDINWRARFDSVQDSDRAAVDIGISALKTLILINDGSLVALLAFVGQIWNKEEGRKLVSQVLGSSYPFMWGLISGGAAITIAYFYQSAITSLKQHDFWEFSGQTQTSGLSKKVSKRIAKVTCVVMILLAFISYVAFFCGMLGVSRILQG